MAERSAKQLGLSKADLPNSIIEVISTLNKNGFEAYIVGGGVRDTLLGLNPKDFDAVTDAKPYEVKDTFGKRCRIIGRRFQLAHVYSGRDMIEVATFRAPPPNGNAHTTSDGMIVRDNVWGDIHQDFERRDFSINAMYYQPLKGVVHDFCNALDDIKNKTIRLLGHAPVRIEEDPVRLLRALRFKAKLGFTFDNALAEQFHDDNWALLDQVSPHRLYDESQKMFTGGYLASLLPLLFKYGAIQHLVIYPSKKPTALVNQVAINTDKRIAMGKSINPAFFYAALLWENYLYQLAKFKKKNMPFHDAQLQAATKVIQRQRIKTAIPKFAEQFIRDIWLMQPKLANPRIKQVRQLAEHSRFRAGFDFLLLREQCDDAANPLSESTNGMGEWWQNYQVLPENQKQQAIDDLADDSRRGMSRSSRNRNRNRNCNKEGSKKSGVGSAEQAAKEMTKLDAVDKSQHRKQDTRLVAERAQLQQLSLGKAIGVQAESGNQPSPLFTISANKLAKQVPNQAQVDAQEALVSVRQSHNGKQRNNKKLETNSPQQNTKNQGKKKSELRSEVEVKAAKYVEEVISESGAVPHKRRRRLPSQETTQKELAERSSEAKPKQDSASGVNTVKDVATAVKQPVQTMQGTTKQRGAGKESAGTKKASLSAKANKPAAEYENTSVGNRVTVSSLRVPTTRRRRQPSSKQTVIERLGL